VLSELIGSPVPDAGAPSPDWGVVKTQLARADGEGKRLLIRFTTPGCAACAAMDDTTLVDPQVQALMSHFESTELDLQSDGAWKLFDTLEFVDTPAFVVLSGDGKVLARTQGYKDAPTFSKFLEG
jgi:thioredoxin-related protein